MKKFFINVFEYILFFVLALIFALIVQKFELDGAVFILTMSVGMTAVMLLVKIIGYIILNKKPKEKSDDNG